MKHQMRDRDLTVALLLKMTSVTFRMTREKKRKLLKEHHYHHYSQQKLPSPLLMPQKVYGSLNGTACKVTLLSESYRIPKTGEISYKYFPVNGKECRTIRQKPFRQIAENHFGKLPKTISAKLPNCHL
ncbi:hypothetical protein OUZ56_010559 [Daphnia magna]|uniref:Uncharacterized protein n=1 Tax=Daphnia magna TaxID=35525 RepID=A0ABR0AIV1_9CRUS|nr:hypothetical protein OUZ56_010559 [Daphnia magna]